jgi:metal-responsive CopG/Arc/MetJ family transcriptional regulator
MFMRLNISMDEELVKKVDEAAAKMHVSRSAYIAFAVSQKIQADEMLNNMPEVLSLLREIKEKK